jgi:hypothetical protein
MFPPVRPVFVVSYEDREFMHAYRRKTHSFRKSVPDFAFDDDAVRRIVAAHVAILARVSFIPEDIRMLRLLNRRAIKLLKKSTSWEWHQLARAAQRTGLPAYYAAVIYKSWRLGWNSVQVARDLGVSPIVVRQALVTSKHIFAQIEGAKIRIRVRKPWRSKKALVPTVPSEVQRSGGPGVAEPHEPTKALVAA